MMKRFILFLLMMGAGHALLRGQHQEICEPPVAFKGKEQPVKDTVSILSAFKRGQVNGHFRYFLMATDNAPGLTDYLAQAGGGGIRFETAAFHRFQFAVGGSYIFNVGSSDLSVPDSLSGAYNRYEVGLFDISHPEKRKDLDRLEEFYLKYSWKTSAVTLGRQFINTPFINLQDGRMRPTVIEGLVVRWNDLRDISLEAGFLNAISPRSTVGWYSMAESIGLYPSGVNPDGTKSAYRGNVNSEGVGYIGVTHRAGKALTTQVWDLYVDNVMNTIMLQADYAIQGGQAHTWKTAVQWIRQDAVGDGGHPEQVHSYFPSGGQSMVLGVSAGYQHQKWSASVAYTRITGDGRYLMPREWGRDPFFTFMPRERNEGLADVDAVVMKLYYKNTTRRYALGLAAGYFALPDVRDTRLNKYGMPSYVQINLDLRYAFTGLLEGLDIQYLLAAKRNAGETYGEERYVIHKVDMMSHNVVMNYHF